MGTHKITWSANGRQMRNQTKSLERDVVFIGKATPEDDEVALWLAPRLEAAGYILLRIACPLNPVTGGERVPRNISRPLSIACEAAFMDAN
jgi:hypothetical protein